MIPSFENIFKRFLEANRQTGTSTALIRAVRETKGYLIVNDTGRKNMLIKKDPELKDHILTCTDIETEVWRGNKMGTIFFDTDAVCRLINTLSKKEENTKKETVNWVYQDNTITWACDQIDGYNVGKHTEQFNIKLTEEDAKDIKNVNADFFEGEASNSMLGRILVRKGIQYFKKLKESF